MKNRVSLKNQLKSFDHTFDKSKHTCRNLFIDGKHYITYFEKSNVLMIIPKPGDCGHFLKQMQQGSILTLYNEYESKPLRIIIDRLELKKSKIVNSKLELEIGFTII